MRHTVRRARLLTAPAAVWVTLVTLHAGAADPAPSDLQRRTAAYVHGFIAALSNVVAEESMQFKGNPRVLSQFLLVRHPGSPTDFLAFRDVVSVNDAAIPNRDAHLLELFRTDFATAVDRATQISIDGSAHVPVIFNPLFAIGFLQAEYQGRFRLEDGKGPVRDFPADVRTLSFVETVTPTLLRAGAYGNVDVPTRGKAWVEESSGKVLQTELQVRSGRKLTKVTTRFAVDSRLGVMVPTEMRTEAPDAVALYRDFRRFNVTTDEQLFVEGQPATDTPATPPATP